MDNLKDHFFQFQSINCPFYVALYVEFSDFPKEAERSQVSFIVIPSICTVAGNSIPPQDHNVTCKQQVTKGGTVQETEAKN